MKSAPAASWRSFLKYFRVFRNIFNIRGFHFYVQKKSEPSASQGGMPGGGFPGGFPSGGFPGGMPGGMPGGIDISKILGVSI